MKITVIPELFLKSEIVPAEISGDSNSAIRGIGAAVVKRAAEFLSWSRLRQPYRLRNRDGTFPVMNGSFRQ